MQHSYYNIESLEDLRAIISNYQPRHVWISEDISKLIFKNEFNAKSFSVTVESYYDDDLGYVLELKSVTLSF